MPIIYLSPSTQDWNHFVNGGTEEYYMNLIAGRDGALPALLRHPLGAQHPRHDRCVVDRAIQPRQLRPAPRAALQRRTRGGGRLRQGSEVYYYPTSAAGKRAADIIAENLKEIYPYPWLVKTVPTTRARRGRQDARARRADRIRLPRQPRGRRMDQGQHRRDRRQRRLFADRLLRHSLRPAAGAAPGHRRRPGRAGSTSASSPPPNRSRRARRNGRPHHRQRQWNNWYVVNFRARSVTPIPATSASRADGGEA